MTVTPAFTQFCRICHNLTQTSTNQNQANYFKWYLIHFELIYRNPAWLFRVLDESCSLFDPSCLLHLHAYVSITQIFHFKWAFLWDVTLVGGDSSLFGFVALLKHFQSWDHRCHRCRDTWGIFVSLILSHPLFFIYFLPVILPVILVNIMSSKPEQIYNI